MHREGYLRAGILCHVIQLADDGLVMSSIVTRHAIPVLVCLGIEYLEKGYKIGAEVVTHHIAHEIMGLC